MSSLGMDAGALRDDLPPEMLLELFGGIVGGVFKLVAPRRLGLEDTAAAAASLFLHGARAPGQARASPPNRRLDETAWASAAALHAVA